MKHRHRLIVWLVQGALVCTLMAVAGGASAGSWRWGCKGALGNQQIVFNRDHLVLISGGGLAAKLEDFVYRDDLMNVLERSANAISVTATYLSNNADGFAKTMRFTGKGTGHKLTLTELSSRKIGHSERLINGCRHEFIDRFRKRYRVEGDNEPPRTVKLVCMEYQLSTRGGRVCK